MHHPASSTARPNAKRLRDDLERVPLCNSNERGLGEEGGAEELEVISDDLE